MESIPPAYAAWRVGTITQFVVPTRQATQAVGIDSLGSIPGLLKRLQIWAQLNMLQADLQVVLEELDTGKKGGLEFHDFVRMMTR